MLGPPMIKRAVCKNASPARKNSSRLFTLFGRIPAGQNVSPTVMRGVAQHFFSVGRNMDPKLDGLAIQFIERI